MCFNGCMALSMNIPISYADFAQAVWKHLISKAGVVRSCNVAGQPSVPECPTNLDNNRAMAYGCSRCGLGDFDISYLISLSVPFSVSLSLEIA